MSDRYRYIKMPVSACNIMLIHLSKNNVSCQMEGRHIIKWTGSCSIVHSEDGVSFTNLWMNM